MLPKEFAIENILTLVKQPFMKNLIFFAFIFITTQLFGQLKDFDGNIYKYINIGNQAWMGENLKVKHFNNGDLIPEAKTDEEWKAAFEKKTPAFRKFKITNDCNCAEKCGLEYNYYCLIDPRRILPRGFVYPSKIDFILLANELIKNARDSVKIIIDKYFFNEGDISKDSLMKYYMAYDYLDDFDRKDYLDVIANSLKPKELYKSFSNKPNLVQLPLSKLDIWPCSSSSKPWSDKPFFWFKNLDDFNRDQERLFYMQELYGRKASMGSSGGAAIRGVTSNLFSKIK